MKDSRVWSRIARTSKNDEDKEALSRLQGWLPEQPAVLPKTRRERWGLDHLSEVGLADWIAGVLIAAFVLVWALPLAILAAIGGTIVGGILNMALTPVWLLSRARARYF